MLSRAAAALTGAIVTAKRDIAAARARDPAAQSLAEILTCYPGLHAIWIHRVAHGLYARDLRFPARLLSHLARAATGIEIHPGARIGGGFFIDHGMGVVIGETTEIGEDVTLYQGVTLGGTGKDVGKRHPTVGDGVIVGTGAGVLGPLVIGEGAKIGAGAIVIHDVPANSTVVGNPGRAVTVDGQRIRARPAVPDIDHIHLPDPIAEALSCMVRRLDELEQEVKALREGREPPARNGDDEDCLSSAREDLEAALASLRAPDSAP